MTVQDNLEVKDMVTDLKVWQAYVSIREGESPPFIYGEKKNMLKGLGMRIEHVRFRVKQRDAEGTDFR